MAPSQTWVRCACSGCAGASEIVGGCTTSACGDAAGLAAACRTFCANWGLTGCASTAPATNGCVAQACTRCVVPADCAVGRCLTAANACGRECNSSADCGCEACVAEPGAAGVCLPPRSGAICASDEPPVS